ncbi:bifunctional [glutamate--ammonia ligase]-adenylyl-L-tyrosine phosphorylase/[glutamate--ammonia-ligase] adenylyltransferase [Rothia nasimurium]|uniref:Bifunctional glutamine synthetase adenylyltransferase/adenylyl-removing enzyme n=1 Tax=Luteibacter anthropi TaxID=564369 RepID=A0A7X5ZJY2_9GAMM|nr:bifunctional [glutamate--ammonia ligase]-adenylyl-L-tyrosine phosphorylase/[glutamate--ammonia-ligase] adenylyltransferase [Luteibacter anthropi]NII08226.1 bifunctional [glutamate--ammonia ligase]-adenylyl-L-tyrosine phosphorylase/[glutamate--ammonia-ligase] adenylyltransferase [Luteibacter anthropi]
MNTAIPTSRESPELRALIDQRYADVMAACRVARIPLYDDAGVAERIRRTLLASDFAFEVFRRQPELLAPAGLERLRAGSDAGARGASLDLPVDETACMAVLRRFRHAEAVRLVFRDVNGLDDIDETLSSTSTLYEALLASALRWSEAAMHARYGRPRDAEGIEQRMVVVGFGKLGGNELNFSSDIDLVLAYASGGETDGARPLDNGEYFIREARQLVRLLAEPTVDGICARVDLRLRPFGNAGRLALPFSAMEQYYQREGRDWERYAWIKARPVAGDRTAGRELQDMLRPFVYRRYLDYTAFAGLREMKSLIDAEVARKDLAGNLKLGPGGIREIEFVVQLTQMIRGGRDPALRVRGLLPALKACESRGYIPAARAKLLREAYVFLRRLENRVQMLRDAQTHDIPDDDLTRERLALGLDYASWHDLERELTKHREAVSSEFAAVLVPEAGGTATVPAADRDIWTKARDASLNAATMEASGFVPGNPVAEELTKLPNAASVRSMSARSSERLERLMPQLIGAARASVSPSPSLLRLIRLVQAVARRSSYLALLDEQPNARRRVAGVFADSAFLAERVIAQPLLLDDVLDPRIDQLPLKRADISAEIARTLGALDERDAERELERINEFRSSIAFRLGLAFNDARADATATARRLAGLAEAVVGAVLALAMRELIAQHGRLPGEGSGFAVLGYGSLGGEELGFASDLDLVFVYDGKRANLMSDGPRQVDGTRWYQRLAQRVMHWLGAQTHAGKLYEVDTRLRPDGSKGLLVASVDAFEAYQRDRAWTWEHQALQRARHVAGDERLGGTLAHIRRDILAVPRDGDRVRSEVSAMRTRWRAERDRSTEALVDVKQGRGALIDIEFMLQGMVLAHAATHPTILDTTASSVLVDVLRDVGLLTVAQADVLHVAHADLLQMGLACTLDLRSRVVARTPELDALCQGVSRVAVELGFDFESSGDAARKAV